MRFEAAWETRRVTTESRKSTHRASKISSHKQLHFTTDANQDSTCYKSICGMNSPSLPFLCFVEAADGLNEEGRNAKDNDSSIGIYKDLFKHTKSRIFQTPQTHEGEKEKNAGHASRQPDSLRQHPIVAASVIFYPATTWFRLVIFCTVLHSTVLQSPLIEWLICPVRVSWFHPHCMVDLQRIRPTAHQKHTAALQCLHHT